MRVIWATKLRSHDQKEGKAPSRLVSPCRVPPTYWVGRECRRREEDALGMSALFSVGWVAALLPLPRIYPPLTLPSLSRHTRPPVRAWADGMAAGPPTAPGSSKVV